MTPAQAVAALDRALAAGGTPVTLRRVSGTDPQTFTDCACPAKVAGGAAPAALPGGELAQAEIRVILSPSALAAAGWPVPIRRGDKVLIAGRARQVEAAEAVELAGAVVRWNLRVAG